MCIVTLSIDTFQILTNIVVCSLVGGCGSDGVNDSYVENNNGNDEDVDDADDDTTLVKQSQSVAAAAAASGTEQHLESKIADLQRYDNLYSEISSS